MKPVTAAVAALTLTSATGSLAEQLPAPPVARIFEFVVAPEHVDSFIAAGRDNILASLRDEPGVLSIYLTTDKADPTRLYVVEAYRDEAAYEAHRETEHFQAFVRAVDGKFLSRRVIETSPAVLGAQSFTWSAK